MTVLVAIFVGPWLFAILNANIEIVRFLVAVTAILLFSIPAAFIIIYMEMKVIALMNLRVGPDRVGPFGSLLSVVHGLKVLMKEDFTPTGADRIVFTWAPVVVFLTAVMTFLVIPFGPGLVGADFNIGLLYLFAIGGMTVVGLLMAGWSSFNKYSLLGGLRSAAQVVSYEIPLTLSVVGLILLAGTMSVYQIGAQQSGWFTDWFVFRQPLGALIFFIAATAEANRTPFDLTEADSEIVAGFATEYSGMRFGFLFFAEYVNVFIISALMTTLYFGAWNAPFDFPHVVLGLDPGSLGNGLLILLATLPLVITLLLAAPFYLIRSDRPAWQALLLGFITFNVVAVGTIFGVTYLGLDWVAGLLWFLLKAFLFVFLFVWMRGTLPRVRLDQLMNFAWKWLLPASLLNLFLTAAAIVVVGLVRGQRMSTVPGMGMVRGMGFTLRRFFAPKATVRWPEQPADVPPKFRGRLQLLYDEWGTLKCETCFQCAQACPIECIDMGGMDTKGRFHVHWGPAETFGERREESALRRSGRTVPDAAYARFDPVDTAALDEILDRHDYDPKDLLAILEETQAEYGYLPVGALKHISRITGTWYAMIYGTATYYRHLRFEPPTIEAAPAGEAHQAIESAYRSALEASLGFGGAAGGA